jgi:hypothetical protein
MKRLLLTLALFSTLFSAQGQAPYTFEYLTNLVRVQLPMQADHAIWPTNFWQTFDPILQSVVLPPTYIFKDIGSMHPSYGLRLTAMPAAVGGEHQVVVDPTTKEVRTATGSYARTYGTATLSGGVYTIASPNPPYPFVNIVYPDGMAVDFRPDAIGGGSDTLKVGLGPTKPIKLSDLAPVPSGDIVANSMASAIFSTIADAWILQNPASGLVFDSTMYTSVSGSTVTAGVKTNGLPVNRLGTIPASTLLGNPTGSTATPSTITLGAGLSFSGTTITASGGGGGNTIYTGDGAISGARVVTLGANQLMFDGLNTGGTLRVSADLARIAGKTNLLIGTEEIWVNSGTAASRLKFSTQNTSVAGTAQVGDVLTINGITGGVANTDFQKPGGYVTNVTADFTVPGGVSTVIVDATSGPVTITLPQDSEERTVTVFKKDNNANHINVVNGGGDAFSTGLGVTPVRLFLRGEYVTTKGIGGNLNIILQSQSIDLGTLDDMRNYTMLFRSEFADNTVASFWGQNGMSTASYSADPSHAYVSTITTGAATNGMGYFGLRNASAQLTGSSPIVLTYNFMLPTLPTVADYYVVEVGLLSALAATGVDLNDADAVVFRYASEENAGKFRFRVCAGGIGNSLYTEDVGPAPAANTWYRVTIFASTTRAWLFINDVTVGPVTTGLPTAATMTIGGRIQKGIGTTARLMNLDYFKSGRPAAR